MPKTPPQLKEINKNIDDLSKKLEEIMVTEPSLALFVYLDLLKAMTERNSLENMQLYDYMDKKTDKIAGRIEFFNDKLGTLNKNLKELAEKKSFWGKIKPIFNK
jgi:hypothetical protein